MKNIHFHVLIVFFVIFGVSSAFSQAIYNYQAINLKANDIVYSAKQRLIYASIASTDINYGNTIVAINPFTKQITNSIFAGSEPTKLAMSPDEQVLYVVLNGSCTYKKLNLNTFSVEQSYSLGSDSDGPLCVQDIAVLPTNNDSVAISRRGYGTCCGFRGVAIYDNGIPRPLTVSPNAYANLIEVDSTGSTLYGYNASNSEYGFRRFSINENGLSIISTSLNLICCSNTDIKFSKNRIYSTKGVIINTNSNALEATLAVNEYASSMAIDEKNKLAIFLADRKVKFFDTENFRFKGEFIVSESPTTYTSSITRWGRRGLVYRSDTKIAFFETSLVPSQPNISDFNGDEIADYAVFRPSNSLWFSTKGVFGYKFGISTDIPVGSDYDGDNRTDLAVYRDGNWYILNSGTQTFSSFQFGLASDKPVPADYDGDQKTDIAVYRNGDWYISQSSNSQFQAMKFGLASDKPIPSDFDGDGKCDYAVYREGIWYILTNGTFQFSSVQFGVNSAQPVPADYDGDGKSDIAVYQNVFDYPAYYILGSSNNQVATYPFLLDENSVAFPSDYDGDGKADVATFTPTGGFWRHQNSSNNQQVRFLFGQTGDLPIITN